MDLRGYDDNPVTADQGVLALLDAMGVRGADLPPTTARQYDAYRALLAERRDRMLLILDNASDPSQYLPLLPDAAHRMDRQQVLDRPEPPALDVILHEAALRMEFGRPKVARRQLDHLLRMSERDSVTLWDIPFKAGGFPGAGQSVIYAEAAVPRLDTVELDSTHSPEFIDTEAQLGRYRAQLDAAAAVALGTDASLDSIRTLIRDIKAGKADHLL